MYFGARQVECLGYVIEAEQIKIKEERIEQIRKLKRPTTVMELRKALRSFAFVQRWIPDMAEITKPLYGALERNGRQTLIWTEEIDKTFTILKGTAANLIALNIPDFSKKFVLVTDASNEASGAMLANREGDQIIGQLKPIAFFHYTLTFAERRYSTKDKKTVGGSLGN